MMRSSRVAVFVLLLITVLIGANCSYYNRIIARKNLVDGSKAYKDRKFPEAEQLFRDAVGRDPSGESIEGKTAQLFLARTLHSMYIGDRKNSARAEEAIAEYQKALALNPNDQSSYKAIASLYENLQKNNEWLDWVTKRSTNTSIPPEQRAEALTSLAAKKNSCANDITDTDATKKTVTKDGKPSFEFVKPANEADFTTLKGCVADGLALTQQTMSLESDQVKNAASLDVKSLTDQQLKSNQDLLKVFESARSYRASLLVQAMRLAEMEGRTEDRDRLKQESEDARKNFLSLSDVVKKIQAEIDERIAAQQAEQSRNAANKAPAANSQ
jgi:tetratricopeptide (TPR) repeat protein